MAWAPPLFVGRASLSGALALRRDSSPCAVPDGLAGLTMKRARKEVLAHIPEWLFRLLAPLGLAEKSRMYGTRAKAQKGDVATQP